MAPKPAVGRIVHAVVDPTENNAGDIAPAIITRVWSDVLVNIRVLLDADPGDQRSALGEWRTSVPLAESREALDEAHRAQWGTEDAATFGAFWPPHV
jgi:hypothetical protein